ncbi:MAG: hypothetical protein AAGC55_02070 [Myxococcota bacterium]
MTGPYPTRHRFAILAALALGGCGSTGSSELPAPVADECAVPVPSERPADGTPLPADIAAAVAPHWDAVAAAMTAGDADAVRRAVCDARAVLGIWQGVAEASGSYRATTANPVDPGAVAAVFTSSLPGLRGSEPWARNGGSTHGDDMTEALRTSCGMISAYAVAATFIADPSVAAEFISAARTGADWLIAVQRPEGHWGFPDLTDDAARWLDECVVSESSVSECRAMIPRVFELAMLGKERWEAAGRPDGVLVDGWFVDDDQLDPGGLQFDTGECGGALLAMYRVTAEPVYLDAARRASLWAAAEVPVPNWNYNAFSVGLLAHMAALDPGPNSWAEQALAKARLGVMPGVLPDGRWVDPHNARIVYHMILLRALAHLDTQVDDPRLSEIVAAANRRSGDELRAFGATAFDDGIEAHLAARRAGHAQDGAVERLINGALPGGRPDSLSLAWWLAEELDSLP